MPAGRRSARFAFAATVLAAALASSAAPSWPQAGGAPALQAEPADTSFPPDIRRPSEAENARIGALWNEAQRIGLNTPAAEPLYREVIALNEATFGPNHPITQGFIYSLGLSLYLQRRYGEAEPHFQRALAIAEARYGANSTTPMNIAHVFALNHYHQNHWVEAVTGLRRVIAARPANDPASFDDQALLATSLDELGQRAEARQILLARLTYAERVSPNSDMHARALRDYGVAIALTDVNPVGGAPYLERALAIAEARLPQNQDTWARTAEYYADAYEALNRASELEPLLRRLLAYREGQGDSVDLAGALERLARRIPWDTNGDEARRLAERALTLTNIRSDQRVSAMMTLGGVAASQQRMAESDAWYRRALAIVESDSGAISYRSNALDMIANALVEQNDYAGAESLMVRVLQIREADLGPQHLRVADALTRLALIQFFLNKRAESDAAYVRAIAIYERQLGPLDPETLSALSGRAMFLAFQNGSEAEPAARRAVDGLTARWGADAPVTAMARLAHGLGLASIGRREEADAAFASATASLERTAPGAPATAGAHGVVATWLVGRGRPAEALEHARAAARIQATLVRQAGAATPDSALLAGLSAQQASVGAIITNAAWDVAAQQPAQAAALRAEAFEAAQIATSSGAGDALALGGARIAAEQAGLREVVSAWRNAQDRIARIDAETATTARLGAEGDAIRRRLLAERTGLDAERAAREAEVRQRFPRYFDLVESSMVRIGDAQRLMREDEVLIVVAGAMPMSAAHPYVFALTRNASAWAEVGLTGDELSSEIAALHGMLTTGGATRAPSVRMAQAPRGYDRARAHRLYQALFGAPEIATLVNGEQNWVLAPQGALMSLPFAALVTEAPAGDDADPAALRATRWLGLERALSVTPAVSALRAQRGSAAQTRAGSRLPFFGLGDPAFGGAETATVSLQTSRFYSRNATNVEELRRLPRLARTATEIQALARSFGANRDSFVLGAQATEAEIVARDNDGRLGRADVIAFATHGLVAGDLDNSLAEPALALTPPSGSGPVDPRNDGLLTASEAARLRLSARWVILSACNTAAGGRPNADGLTGLARAFFYAGARTLLVSHWPVGDVAAERLTTRAVALQRSENLATPEALRRSMRALLADTSADATGRSFAHPSAWAPFALVSAE